MFQENANGFIEDWIGEDDLKGHLFSPQAENLGGRTCAGQEGRHNHTAVEDDSKQMGSRWLRISFGGTLSTGLTERLCRSIIDRPSFIHCDLLRKRRGS
jgi:hypothetical protein